MSDYEQTRRATAASLRAARDQILKTPVMVGFDGMVDTILEVVDKRRSADDYDPLQQMADFGKKIIAAAGKSANYEMVVKQIKLGGNGPIMANALALAGLPTTFIGGVGNPDLHEVYQPLADRCEQVIGLADPAYTDAVEFHDGKLMFGKHNNTRKITPDALRDVVGDDRLREIFAASGLIAIVNWTMIPYTSDIWKYLIADILPIVKQRSEPARIFIDLTDPEKRTAEDIAEALELISQMQPFAPVTLGLNLKESEQVAESLGIDTGDDPEANIEQTAAAIRKKLDIHTVLIHPLRSAAAARCVDGKETTAFVQAPYTKTPKLSTGAGDNFNAGCCIAALADLPLDQMLAAGNAASGYYVRHAASPTLDDLIDFVETMPEPED